MLSDHIYIYLHICIFVYVSYSWPKTRPNWLTFLEQSKVTSAKKFNFFFKNFFFFQCQFFLKDGRRIGLVGYITPDTVDISNPEQLIFIEEVQALKEVS